MLHIYNITRIKLLLPQLRQKKQKVSLLHLNVATIKIVKVKKIKVSLFQLNVSTIKMVKVKCASCSILIVVKAALAKQRRLELVGCGVTGCARRGVNRVRCKMQVKIRQWLRILRVVDQFNRA